jgi:hypothetical protein
MPLRDLDGPMWVDPYGLGMGFSVRMSDGGPGTIIIAQEVLDGMTDPTALRSTALRLASIRHARRETGPRFVVTSHALAADMILQDQGRRPLR